MAHGHGLVGADLCNQALHKHLRAAGVEVWFDKSELVGGDAWDAKIRKQIAECALFVPVISAATQARREGYFRLEWRLAAQRTHMMSEQIAFLLPVVIDATRDGRPAGTLTLLRPTTVGALPQGLSSHDFGLKDLFAAAALLGAMPDVHLFTLSVETLHPMCLELSPPVAAALPAWRARLEKMAASAPGNPIAQVKLLSPVARPPKK